MAIPPLSPTIAAPVSVCSAALEIGGLIPGANVVATNEGRNVINGVATATRQVFALEPGEGLAPRTSIEVRQTLRTGESSPSTHVDLQVQVMREPTRSSDLGAPEFVTPFCRCGECVYLAGCYPGAEITLTSNRGDVLAESKIVGTTARLSLTRPLQLGEVLTATQIACGIDGPSISSDPVLEIPDPYPNPILNSPLLACGRRIGVSNVLPGSTVTVTRDSTTHSACFDLDSLWIGVSEAAQLTGGEVLGVTAQMRDCDIGGDGDDAEPVLPIGEGLPEPSIVGPLCAGSGTLVVSDLYPDALVTVFVDREPVGVAGVTGTTQPLEVPVLTLDTSVHVCQELCGFSMCSEALPVGPPAMSTTPRILPIPYECSTVVKVVDVQPGALVLVESYSKGLIGRAHAITDEVVVRVPSLARGDDVRPSQIACGTRTDGGTRPVRSDPYGRFLPPRILRPPIAGDQSVPVSEVRPGAVVDVFVRHRAGLEWRGANVIPDEAGEVSVLPPLDVDAEVFVRQRLCHRASETGMGRSVDACAASLRVGLKVLDRAWEGVGRRQLATADRRFREFGVRIDLLSVEVLDLPMLRVIGDGGCREGSPSPEFRELHRNRNGLAATDIAMYIVQDILLPDGRGDLIGGCASFDELPAFVMVGEPDSGWFAAHEIVHVAGRSEHSSDPNDLMFNGLGIDLATPPTVNISTDEQNVLIRNAFSHPC